MATPVERTGEPAVGSAASAEEIFHESLMVVTGREDTVGGVDGVMVEMMGAVRADEGREGDGGRG